MNKLIQPSLIKGGEHEDARGKISFVNNFMMNTVKRFYHIAHDNSGFVRAWQGHKKESKWFYCIKGGFEIKLIGIDDWNEPAKDLKVYSFHINDENTEVLHIPPGYVNGFRATVPNAEMLVFSDADLISSKEDDFRFEKNYWPIW